MLMCVNGMYAKLKNHFDSIFGITYLDILITYHSY